MTNRETGLANEVCAHITTLIRTLDTDDQDNALTQEIAGHLAECTTCRRREAELVALLAQYGTHQLLPLPGDLEQRLLDQVCQGYRSEE
ncbi:MAG: hypothetical protein M3014_06770 [Chloroflexota bacterium]|nr:hypothetical protein [Chloroflexota bacterium]